jgi:hypothetical protein
MNKEIYTFIWQYETINTNQQYQGDCADIVFINNGNTTVTINGVTLQIGDGMSDNAFGNEYSNTNYNILFSGGSNPSLVIKKKVYLSTKIFK